MAMDKGNSIAVLTDLIATSENGVKDFRACADAIHNSEAKEFFNDRVRLIERGVKELKAEVRRLGGDPEQQSAAGRTASGASSEMRPAPAGKTDEAILAECARAEDAAVNRYEQALAKELTPEVRTIVERQLAGVLENRDRVYALRDGAPVSRPGGAREAHRGAPPPP